MAKSPSKANDDRQPRQSNGPAIPAMRPPRPAVPGLSPAPRPPGGGARGMNVGPRLNENPI